MSEMVAPWSAPRRLPVGSAEELINGMAHWPFRSGLAVIISGIMSLPPLLAVPLHVAGSRRRLLAVPLHVAGTPRLLAARLHVAGTGGPGRGRWAHAAALP